MLFEWVVDVHTTMFPPKERIPTSERQVEKLSGLVLQEPKGTLRDGYPPLDNVQVGIICGSNGIIHPHAERRTLWHSRRLMWTDCFMTRFAI